MRRRTPGARAKASTARPPSVRCSRGRFPDCPSRRSPSPNPNQLDCSSIGEPVSPPQSAVPEHVGVVQSVITSKSGGLLEGIRVSSFFCFSEFREVWSLEPQRERLETENERNFGKQMAGNLGGKIFQDFLVKWIWFYRSEK